MVIGGVKVWASPVNYEPGVPRTLDEMWAKQRRWVQKKVREQFGKKIDALESIDEIEGALTLPVGISVLGSCSDGSAQAV